MILLVLKVHVLRGEFDKVRKKNEESEDKLQTQIKELQLQLDDMRLEHRLVSRSYTVGSITSIFHKQVS